MNDPARLEAKSRADFLEARRGAPFSIGKALVGQSGKFIEYFRDQLLSARVLRLGRDREKLDQISRLRGGLEFNRWSDCSCRVFG